MKKHVIFFESQRSTSLHMEFKSFPNVKIRKVCDLQLHIGTNSINFIGSLFYKSYFHRIAQPVHIFVQLP